MHPNENLASILHASKTYNIIHPSNVATLALWRTSTHAERLPTTKADHDLALTTTVIFKGLMRLRPLSLFFHHSRILGKNRSSDR